MRRPGKQNPVSADKADDLRAIRAAAVALLARRDFACGELTSRLQDRGFDPTAVATLIAALKHERLLNDERYAEHFVAYHAGRGQGPVRIGRELKDLGLPAELIEAALAERQDWVASARDVRRKKFGAVLPENYAARAKQARFLQYRGFTAGQIRSALGTDIDIGD